MNKASPIRRLITSNPGGRARVRRDRWAKVRKNCAHTLGVGNFIMLVFGPPTAVSLGLAAALAPFTIATALTVTALLAGNLLSLALNDRRGRAELLVGAIGVLQPPHAGERYQETMRAEIRAAKPNQVWAIAINLIANAPRTILGAWVRIPRAFWKRAW